MTERRSSGLAADLMQLRKPEPVPEPVKRGRPRREPIPEPVKRGPGRPPGKRSDPAFRQVTAWVRRDVYRAVMLALIEMDRSRDLGPFVEDLFRDWLKRHPTGTPK